MMGSLDREFQNVQNPALGAYLLWNFIRGYYAYNSSFVPFPLLFVVLPVIFRNDMVEVINSTQKKSGLRYFADKFLTTKILKNDVVSQVHKSSDRMKELTLDSLRIALQANLLSIDEESALVFATSTSERKSEPKEIKKLGKVSEKLGIWCAHLTLHEISQILKVRF